MKKANANYRVWEKDGALFRAPGVRDVPLVDEIKKGGKWVAYEGDRVGPAMFGNELLGKELEMAL